MPSFQSQCLTGIAAFLVLGGAIAWWHAVSEARAGANGPVGRESGAPGSYDWATALVFFLSAVAVGFMLDFLASFTPGWTSKCQPGRWFFVAA